MLILIASNPRVAKGQENIIYNQPKLNKLLLLIISKRQISAINNFRFLSLMIDDSRAKTSRAVALSFLENN